MPKLRLKTYAMIALMVVLQSFGNALLSVGMKQIGAVRGSGANELWRYFVEIMTSGTIWSGIACLLGFFITYLAVLSWADLSYVKPSMAVSYGFVTLLAWAVLHEHISPLRWAGVALICLGVGVVGLTEVRTTAAHFAGSARKEPQA